MSFRAWGVVASAILLATLATGCASEPPTITAPELSESDAVACRALVDALPDTLAGLKRVDVAGDSAYGAAWGDPAIVLTCGVGQPADFTDGSTCIVNSTWA